MFPLINYQGGLLAVYYWIIYCSLYVHAAISLHQTLYDQLVDKMHCHKNVGKICGRMKDARTSRNSVALGEHQWHRQQSILYSESASLQKNNKIKCIIRLGRDGDPWRWTRICRMDLREVTGRMMEAPLDLYQPYPTIDRVRPILACHWPKLEHN
jgi:hypothetical protein